MTVVWCPLAEESDTEPPHDAPNERATLLKCFPEYNSCVCVFKRSSSIEQTNHVTWSRNTLLLKSMMIEDAVIDVSVTLVHAFPDRPSMRSNTDKSNVELGEAKEALFVLSSTVLKVFYLQGGHVIVPLPFKAAKMFETKYGLLLERDCTRPSCLPTWLLLTHPLDDLSRILTIGSAANANCSIGNSSNVVFGNDKSTVVHVEREPSICLTFSQTTGLHSLSEVRLSTPEERMVAEKTMTSFHGAHSNALVTSHWASKSIINSPFSLSGRSSLPSYSPSASMGGHPHPHLSSLASVSRSPFSTHMALHNDFVNYRNNIKHTLIDDDADVGAIAPEFFLSMHHVWTEPLSVAKSNSCSMTSKVFLSVDLIGNHHLCMLNSSSRKLLVYETSDKTNGHFNLVSKYPCLISCVDAEPLPALNMTVVLEYQMSSGTAVGNSLCLYSGATRVARVAFDASDVANDQQLAQRISILHLESSNANSNSVLGSNAGSTVVNDSSSMHSTPLATSTLGFSRSSSMSNSMILTPVQLTSTRPSSAIDPRLEDSLSNLSPVISSAEEVYSKSSAHTIHSLTKVLGNDRVGVLYNNGCVLKLHFPPFCTSHLIEVALDNLCFLLNADVAQALRCDWYASRHAPGPSCLSPSQEWSFFARFILRNCGYDPGRVRLFPMCFFGGPSSPERLSPHAPKKVRPNEESGCNEDWNYLLRSSQHNDCDEAISFLLGLHSPVPTLCPGVNEDTIDEHNDVRNHFDDDYDEVFVNKQSSSLSKRRGEGLDEGSLLFNFLPDVLRALHELFNTIILDESLSFYIKYVAGLTFVLASDLGLTSLILEYGRHFECLGKALKSHQLSSQQSQKLKLILNGLSGDEEFAVISVYQTLKQGFQRGNENITLPSTLPSWSPTRKLLRLFRNIRLGNKDEWVSFVNTLRDIGFTQRSLHCLPSGIELVIRSAIAQKINKKGSLTFFVKNGATEEQYNVLKILGMQGNDTLRAELSSFFCPVNVIKHSCHDGVTGDISPYLQSIKWNKDARFLEVNRLLLSSLPVPITVVQKPNVSDHDFIEEQERALLAKCVRTMALPVGRGALTLFSSYPLLTERIQPPVLNLKGRAPPLGKTIDMEHIDVVPDMTKWPIFHNGVAAGLKVCLAADKAIDSTWIAFNNPDRQANNPTNKNGEHAGVLLGLGLGGHLAKLDRLESFAYIVRGDELTSIGLLLGLASSNVGSLDNELTRMISTQLPPLLSADNNTAHVELPVTTNTQVAAMISLGLLYLGSGHRRMAEVCLRELTRVPSNSEDGMANMDRESYSLASGLALGMITFGQGELLCNNALADLHLPEVLRHAMDGGPVVMDNNTKYVNSQDVNVDLTGPGSIMALGMLFFDSNNRSVANWLSTPSTPFTLEFVRPDLLMLRTIAKGLVLFEDIQPSYTWLRSHVPDNFLAKCLVRPRDGDRVDHETLNQVYCNVTTGAALVMAIKFASSNNTVAFEAIYHHTLKLLSIQNRSLADLIGRSLLEQSICVHILSLSIIMAGSGDLDTLRLIRHLARNKSNKSNLTYGSHLALSLSLGLLFLGAGRLGLKTAPFGRTKEPMEAALAISAMIIAFFPKFPTHSSDNRYHLQALRHLYALTTEPRMLAPASIDNGGDVTLIQSVEIELEYRDGHRVSTVAPLLLPDLRLLRRLTVTDEHHFHRPMDLDRDLGLLKGILTRQGGVWPVEVRYRSAHCVLDDRQLREHSWHTKDDLVPWRDDKLEHQSKKEDVEGEKRDQRVAAMQITSLLRDRPTSFAPFMDVWERSKESEELGIVKMAAITDVTLLSKEMDAALNQMGNDNEEVNHENDLSFNPLLDPS